MIDDLLHDEQAQAGPWYDSTGLLHFGDADAEYHWLTTSVGLVLTGSPTHLGLTGTDSVAFFNRLCTNKMDDVAPGSGRETFLTDAKGHVVGYGHAVRDQEGLSFHTSPGQGDQIVRHLDHYLITEDVQLRDRSSQCAEVALIGPKSAETLATLAPRGPLTEPPGHHLQNFQVELDGVIVSVRVLAERPPPAILLSCPTVQVATLWRALRSAGVPPCGLQSAEAVRIEANRPMYGRDITLENLPQEVGRDRLTISFNKGCYLGQETVARIDSRGHVNRQLCGLRFAGGVVPAAGAKLRAGDQEVGRITSAAFSPRFGSAVGLGYVRREHNAPGTQLESTEGSVRVVSLPMV